VRYNGLLEGIGVRATADLEQYQAQVGTMLAAVRTTDARTMRPLAMTDKHKGAVLAVAAFDLPGRIVGFWHGRGLNRENWRYLSVAPRRRRIYNACGLGFFSVLEKLDPQAEVLVVDDPAEAVYLHTRHFRDHGSPLPVILTSTQRVCDNLGLWRRMPRRPYLFWSPKSCARMAEQAEAAGGLVTHIKCPLDALKRVEEEDDSNRAF
jgi:hypothetical protein